MNERFMFFIRIFLGLPICLAIGATILLLILRLEGALQIAAITVLLALGLMTIIWYALKNKKGARMVEELLNILYKEVNPSAFIEASLAALSKTKNSALRNTLRLNLAVGYEADGDFDSAINVMKEIPIGTADKVSKAMFYNNLAAFYAAKGSEDEALKAYGEGKPYFEKAKADLPIAYLTLTRGLLYYVEGKYEEAVETFENARSKGFSDRHTLAKLQLFHARAHLALGNQKEAKNILLKLCQKKTYPFLLESAHAILNSLK